MLRTCTYRDLPSWVNAMGDPVSSCGHVMMPCHSLRVQDAHSPSVAYAQPGMACAVLSSHASVMAGEAGAITPVHCLPRAQSSAAVSWVHGLHPIRIFTKSGSRMGHYANVCGKKRRCELAL